MRLALGLPQICAQGAHNRQYSGFQYLRRKALKRDDQHGSALKELFWVTIYDKDSAMRAAKRGAIAVWIFAPFVLFGVAGMLFSTPDPSFFDYAVYVVPATVLIYVGVMVKRCNRIAALIVLTMFIALFAGPAVFYLRDDLVSGWGWLSFLPSIILLLLAVNGVRGSFAFHSFASDGEH